MKTNRWYLLLGVGMLALPLVSRAQSPQPKITEIATIPGVSAWSVIRMPNRRVVIYNSHDSLFAYGLATKRSTFITRGFNYDLDISPTGDRIAFTRSAEEYGYVWAVALDPATGAPAGPAQRVTLNYGDTPTFSPDGKLIAFAKSRKDSKTGRWTSLDLAVIPATGGAERVLAQLDKEFDAISWSADGKWIYVQESETVGDPKRAILRVAATGGTAEHVLSYANPGNARKGLINGRLAFFNSGRGYRMNGQVEYVTANGGRGEFRIPSGAQTGNWTFGPPQTVVAATAAQPLHVLDLASGKVRALPAVGVNAIGAKWSPDMRRLAFISGEDASRELVVMNADGSGQRRYPVKGGVGPFWFPDGKSVGYSADSLREIRALTVATGLSRVFATVPTPNRIVTFKWQPDGKSLLTTVSAGPVYGPRSNWAIVEIRLDGTKRVVRDVSVEFPSTMMAWFTSTRQAVVTLGDAAASPAVPTQFVVVPLDGSAARPVSMPALEPGVRLMTANVYSEKWFASTLLAPNGFVGIQVMSTGTDSTRVIRFPANLYTPAFSMLPDGEHLMAQGRAPADHDVTLYSIPLDGSAPRVIGHVSETIGLLNMTLASFSANGKLCAFFAPGTSVSHIYDVDLTPVLKVINKP